MREVGHGALVPSLSALIMDPPELGIRHFINTQTRQFLLSNQRIISFYQNKGGIKGSRVYSHVGLIQRQTQRQSKQFHVTEFLMKTNILVVLDFHTT